jgi:hypothetical protein
MLLLRSTDESWKCERCLATGRHDFSSRLDSYSHLLDDPMTIEQDFWAELAQIQAESIGWIPLDEGAYLHVGSDDAVIQVVGIAKVEMAGGNVLWLV